MFTYAEFGEQLGVSPDGTRAKAKRSGWPVARGKDGKTLVREATVELSEQPAERERCLLQQTKNSPTRFAALEQALVGLVAALRKRAAKAELEAKQARPELGHLREQLIRLKAEQASVKGAAVVAFEAAKRVAEAAIAGWGAGPRCWAVSRPRSASKSCASSSKIRPPGIGTRAAASGGCENSTWA